jgi:hypothetical protein
LKPAPEERKTQPPAAPVASNTPHVLARGGFDVANALPGFPVKSVELAQRFVDAALKLPNVVARREKSGVDIRPNFVRVEALLSRAGRSGIRVSFYDAGGRFTVSPPALKRGMGNYKRAVVESASTLEEILPLIKQAYDLKFGGSRAKLSPRIVDGNEGKKTRFEADAKRQRGSSA